MVYTGKKIITHSKEHFSEVKVNDSLDICLRRDIVHGYIVHH